MRLIVGSQVKAARLEKGMTQKQLAVLLNTTQSRVAQIESNTYEKYSMTTLAKLSVVLDLKLSIDIVPKREKMTHLMHLETSAATSVYVLVGNLRV